MARRSEHRGCKLSESSIRPREPESAQGSPARTMEKQVSFKLILLGQNRRAFYRRANVLNDVAVRVFVVAALAHHIAGIGLVCASKEVLRVDAGRNIAFVANDESRRQRAARKAVGNTVYQIGSPGPESVAETKNSIASVIQSALPDPAPVFVFLGAFPKSGAVLNTQIAID